MWLLANWRLVVGGVGIIAVLGGFFYVKHVINENYELKQEISSIEDDLENCKNYQKLIAEKENEWQKKLASTNARNRDLLERLRDDSAVCVSASGANASTAGNQLSGQVGVKASTVINEAAACDRNTQQLIELQNFIKENWRQ